MTVQQLIDRLREFDPSLEVVGLWDTIPGFEVHRVERLGDQVVLDVGSGGGDWDTVEDDIASGRLDPTTGRYDFSRP